jgi:hypothetical protein
MGVVKVVGFIPCFVKGFTVVMCVSAQIQDFMFSNL